MKFSTISLIYLRKFGLRVLLLLLLSTLGTLAYAQQSLAVIANPEGAPANISSKELKAIFLGEKQRWSTGNKVLIALMKTNTKLGVTVCDRVYDMKPDEMNKYWLALVFQGKASAPYFFNSLSDLQNFVSQNPGAVAIVDDSVDTSDVKTVSVDGKKFL